MTAHTLPRIRQPEAVEHDERLSPARGIISGLAASAIIWAILATVLT